MEQNKITGRILAIDSVSRQGSVSLIHGSSVLASSDRATGNPARAEELLPLVTQILESAGMKLSDLAGVAVATGPGSYSGIRIGISTALGLSSARGFPVLGVSLLEGLAMTVDSGTVTAAVRAGKADVAYQEFEAGEDGPLSLSPPTQDSESKFVSGLAGSKRVVACHTELAIHLANLMPPGIDMLDEKRSLATLIGLFAARFPERSQLRPVYLRSRGHKAAGF